MFGLDDPGQQKTAVTVLLIIGAAVLFYQYEWSPLRSDRMAAEQHLSLIEQTNRQARAVTQPQRVADLKRRESDYRVAMAAYDELLPSAAEVPLLLAQVSSAALTEHVEIVQFTPLEARVGEDLVEFPYDLQVQGRYHEVGRFMAAIVNLPRMVRPMVVSLEGVLVPPAGAFEEPKHEVVATIVLSAFARPIEREDQT